MAQTHGFTLWFTGMLGAGKTTLANYIAARMRQVGRPVEVLDEDELAGALWAGAGDTKDDRKMIVSRLGCVANLLSRNGVAVMVAATSPYKAGREENRRLIEKYLEVFVDCPTERLIQRDTTGRYKKAVSGEIPNFIGITEPYEPPSSPELTVQSDAESVEDAGRRIFQALLDLSLMNTEELKIITGTKMKPGVFKKSPPSKGKAKPKVTKPLAKAAKVAKKKPAPKPAATKAKKAKKK